MKFSEMKKLKLIKVINVIFNVGALIICILNAFLPVINNKLPTYSSNALGWMIVLLFFALTDELNEVYKNDIKTLKTRISLLKIEKEI